MSKLLKALSALLLLGLAGCNSGSDNSRTHCLTVWADFDPEYIVTGHAVVRATCTIVIDGHRVPAANVTFVNERAEITE